MKNGFMNFVPYNIKSFVDNLPEKEKDQTIQWLGKILKRGSIYCGHCDVLIKCSGPCNLNNIRGSCVCGQTCYKCHKGDNYDAPCPSSDTKEDIEEYWKTRYR